MYLPGFYSQDHCIPYRCPCWHFEDASLPSGTKSPAWFLALLFHSCTCRQNTRGPAEQKHCVFCWAGCSTQVAFLMKILMQQVSTAGINEKIRHCVFGECNSMVLHPTEAERKHRLEKTQTLLNSPTFGYLLTWADVFTQDRAAPTGDTSSGVKAAETSRQQQKVHNMAVIILQNDLRPASAEAYLMIWTLVSIIRPVPPFFARYRRSGPLSVHFPSLPCCLSLLWLLCLSFWSNAPDSTSNRKTSATHPGCAVLYCFLLELHMVYF